MFAERPAARRPTPGEVTGYLARVSHPASTAVAGYDLTFSPVKSVSVLLGHRPPRHRRSD